MLDGNLISGGVGEDVFMADIVQAWDGIEGPAVIMVSQEGHSFCLRSLRYMWAVTGINQHLIVSVSFAFHLLGAMASRVLCFFWSCRSHIPVIQSGLPGKQDNTSVAKNAMKEKLPGLIFSILFWHLKHTNCLQHFALWSISGREVPPRRRGRRWREGPSPSRRTERPRPPGPSQRPGPPAASHGQGPPGCTGCHVPPERPPGC